MDSVLFASFGTPKGKCTTTSTTHCDGTVDEPVCDGSGFATSSCHSDHGKASNFTRDVVESYCLGSPSCDIPALSEVFGDNCPNTAKWLSVSVKCSDSWSTKDYVVATNVLSHLTSTVGTYGTPSMSYSFGAWVYPQSKQGIQTIASFGLSIT